MIQRSERLSVMKLNVYDAPRESKNQDGTSRYRSGSIIVEPNEVDTFTKQVYPALEVSAKQLNQLCKTAGLTVIAGNEQAAWNRLATLVNNDSDCKIKIIAKDHNANESYTKSDGSTAIFGQDGTNRSFTKFEFSSVVTNMIIGNVLTENAKASSMFTPFSIITNTKSGGNGGIIPKENGEILLPEPGVGG